MRSYSNITRKEFNVWMSILLKNQNSVLQLIKGNQQEQSIRELIDPFSFSTQLEF